MLVETTTTQDYVHIGLRKRKERQSRIRPEWQINIGVDAGVDVRDIPAKSGLLTLRELEITSDNDAVDILAKIRTREYSAVEVTRAFCKRAAIAQQLVLNVVEPDIS